MRYLFATAVLLLVFSTVARAESIWIEGEDAADKQITAHSWYDSVKKEVLSNRAWAGHFNRDKQGFLTYEFRAATDGSYRLWLRANHVKSSLSYRLNNGPWQSIDLSRDQRGAMNIASDNAPDLRFISWVKVGDVPLRKGSNKIEFRMDSAAQNHGAIDCLCFTTDAWVPSGTTKPGSDNDKGEHLAGPADWFPVIFDDDPLSPESVIDMSHLIEAPAGKHGFLQRDGAALRFQKATQPVKFWAVGAAPSDKSTDQMVQAAKWYRKHGINLVRQHTVLSTVGLMDAQGEFDAEKMDRYDRWFATLKQQGLYTTWSVIYPHHGALLQKHDGYDPELFAELDKSDSQRDGGRGPIVVNDYINLDRRLQDIALRYFDRLLNHTNPHTGLKYKDDPALAVLEFQNESNVFFHTLNSLRTGKPPRFARAVRRLFFQFVQSKYKTREAVGRAWDNRWDKQDNWEAGELGLMSAYHWGGDGPLHEFNGQVRRAGDYIEFLAGLQRSYYARREEEVRRIGFRGVTVTTAWRAGGPAASMANLYADTAADMIDRHNYFGGGDGGHRLVEGKVNNQTHLDRPGTGLLSLALFQFEDRPFAVSEWSMMPPAPYKAEAAPLYAFYGMGLQGWDASYHFNCGSHRMGDGWPGLSKYVSQTPHYMGQFPALAFAVYNNHIQEGEVVAARRLSRDDVFAGKDVLGQSLAGGGHDDKQLVGRLTTPPEAVAIGRVTIGFRAQPSAMMDLSKYWDRQSQTLTSTTGQLVWDYGARCVEVRSPKTQGVIGFSRGTSYDLPGVVAQIKTPFVSLILTPLDNEDLQFSRRILITAMARDRQTGAIYNDDWSRLEQLGGPPLLMEPVQATLRIKGATPVEVWPLDIYGVPKKKQVNVKSDGSFTIDGTYQAYYYVVEK